MRRDSLLFEEQGENLHIVMDVSSEKMLIGNNTGRQVLELCDGSRTVAEIVDSVSASYPQESREKIQEDVDQFLGMTTEMGIVTWT